MPKVELGSIDDVLAADGEARRLARHEIDAHLESFASTSARHSAINRVQ